MGPLGTRAAAGGVATGLTLAGIAAGRRHSRRRLGTIAGGAVGIGYLAATFIPRAPLFGAPVAVEAPPRDFALTFDDGPDPRHTPVISRILAERGHRATFFVLGQAVRAHPEILRLLNADGHEIACHGDDHRLLGFASPREIRRQIALTEGAVLGATGTRPLPLYRAPHGVRSPWLSWVVGRLGHHVCAWDGAVFDTAEPGADVIVGRVRRLLRPGAVILLHDGDGSGNGASRGQTVAALPAILDEAERRGLRSVGLGRLVSPARRRRWRYTPLQPA
jgi:peptidoglycan/xylan/chitin deacetylase (PgdA/CDA1 family)